MRTKHEVFICYFRETGSALAQLFCTQLDVRGIQAFLDVREHYPGPFPSELRDRIFQAPCFLVLITAGCLDSRWVQEEIKHAFDANCKIVVVRDASLTLSPETPRSAAIQELMDLNHIPYMHEFSDEALGKALAQIELQLGRRHRKRRGCVVMVSVFAMFGLATTVALRLGSMSHRNVQQVEVLPSPEQDPLVDAPMVAPGALSPEAKAPAHIGGAAGENANPVPVSRVAPPKPKYCYRLSGYDPTSNRDRTECRELKSKRACADDQAVALDNSIWTSATPCKPCNCPLHGGNDSIRR